ncbi:MAG: hypothetical protein KF836_11875 [Fimbriimonadaceae bacterium]|nr:hypothetical protein [Fimbriimonadaceae bacterium]
MPKKKEELETATEKGRVAKSNTDSTESTTKKRKRRTADDILAAAEPATPTPAEKPKRAPRVRKTAAKAETKVEKPAEKAETPVKAAPAKRAPGTRTTAKPKESATPVVQPVAESASTKTPLFRKPVAKTLAEEVAEEKANPQPKKSAPAPAVEAEKPRRTRRASKSSEPEKASADEVSDTDGIFTLQWRSRTSSEEKTEKPNRRDRKKQEPQPVAEEETYTPPTKPERIEELGDSEGRVFITAWRTAGKPAAKSEPSKSEDEANLAPRRSRNRRRKDRDDNDGSTDIVTAPFSEDDLIEESVAFRKREEAEPEVKAPVQAPRPPIHRSEEAAQVALHRGHPAIIKNKSVISPIFFYADARLHSQRGIVMEELKEAADQGIQVFSFLVDVQVDVESASKSVQFTLDILEQAVAVAPNIQVVPRISFKHASDWMSKFPDCVYQTAKRETADPSVCDDAYWGEAENTLIAVIQGLQQSKHKDRILGVHFDQEEWFLEDGDGYDVSTAAVKKFQEWLRFRYRNDIVSLRASWFDGSAQFDSIQIPDFQEGLGGEEFVRTDRRARRWVDYHLFCSDEIVDRIGQMCYAAKKASDGDYLVGASYGFTFEWSHPYSGHLSLGKLLRCPELDYAAGPSSYRDREPGGTAAFPFPVDSFALNGKLYMSEDDFRTPISGREEHQAHNPIMKTPQALEAAHWRGIGGALAHEGGVIWMDSNGGGWLNSPGIWQRGNDVHDLLTRSLAAYKTSPDVAFFVDERSLTYLTDPRAFEVLVQQSRESMLRAGLSVGFYLLSDLAHRENFPESKLYVFVNAWDIRPEVRSAIKSRLQRNGKTLLWLYTAGLFEAGRDSLERVREVTGIALRPQPFNCKSGTTLLNTRDELSSQLPQEELAEGGQLEPSYFAIPEDASVLGEYTDTGLPSFVVRHFVGDQPDEKWTSVFLGEPIVSPGLFRALAHQAGAHVWSFDNDLVHANAPFVTIHCSGTGSRTLMLPDNWAAYHLDDKEYMPVENSSIKFRAVDGSTHTFLVGTMGDIQSILKADKQELITVTEPIVRAENTLHWDRVNFDVQVMKLDEWVEDNWSEEHADDLLLRPSMIENDLGEELTTEIEPERDDRGRSTGRRRQRRRRGNDKESRRGPRDQEFGETGVSIVFRKRD